jgi:hypothetical protein
MKQTLRIHAAAALMLLPVGAALVAQPAAAAPRQAFAQPAVRAVILNSDAGLAPGATLRLHVFAAPGAGSASVRLRGSGIQVALQEQAPGNYIGSYRLRRSDRVDPNRMMVAQLSWHGNVVTQNFSYPPAFQALAMGNDRDFGDDRRDARRGDDRRGEARDQRDDQAPRISELTPSNGARVGERGRTSIHARFDDHGSGIDQRSVRVRVDGLDVTNDARIGDDQVAYVERLGRGRHTAEISVRDRAGNIGRTSWSFNVL